MKSAALSHGSGPGSSIALSPTSIRVRDAIIEKFIEKPRRILEKNPSRIIGRYILPFQIMDILERMKPMKNKEIQLTDALSKYLMKNPGSFIGIKSKSKIFDCGSKKGFLSANMYLSMQDDEMRQHLSTILKNY